MQCVILAAGAGTRMRELTKSTPKPLLLVLGKHILAHIFEALPHEVDEVILIVEYLKEQFYETCKDEYLGKTIRYVDQQHDMKGTAGALFSAQNILHGKFLVLLGDDIHGKGALREALEKDLCVLAAPSRTPEKFGVIQQKADGSLDQIIEKPENPPSNLVNTGAMVLDMRIFSHAPEAHESGEYYLPHAVNTLAQETTVSVIEQPQWIPLGSPEDILALEANPPRWLV